MAFRIPRKYQLFVSLIAGTFMFALLPLYISFPEHQVSRKPEPLVEKTNNVNYNVNDPYNLILSRVLSHDEKGPVSQSNLKTPSNAPQEMINISSLPIISRSSNETVGCHVPEATSSDLRHLGTVVNVKTNMPAKGEKPGFSTLKDGMLSVTCPSKPIIWTGEMDKRGKSVWVNMESNPMKLKGEFVWVKCGSVSNTHVQNVRNESFYNEAKFGLKNRTKNPLNVMIIMQDSISRAQFLRSYKETISVLKDLNADSNSPSYVIDFQKYHALGSNSLPNKAFLWGDFCWEKSCTHRWKANETRVRQLFEASGSIWDNQTPNTTIALLQDWLWKSFSPKDGYVHMYGEEELGRGRKGSTYGGHSIMSFFDNIQLPILFPSDIFRQTWKEREFASDCGSPCPPKISGSTVLSSCNGNKLTFNLIFDYIKQFWSNYNGVGRFAGFMFDSAHDSNPKSIACIDYGLSDFLKDLKELKVLEDTVVIMVSDHGMKYGNFFKTATGKTENLLPHLFMLFPRQFLDREENHEIRKNLQMNQNTLISPHDLHFTIKHISSGVFDKPYQTGNTYSMSLFDEIPDRDCEECGIPANWCLCYEWSLLDVKDQKVKDLALFAVENLNIFVKNGTSVCKTLTLKSISSAHKADFSTSTVSTFRIIFDVEAPRSMTFRATMVERDGKFWMDQWDIEQISEWGKFVKCRPNDKRPPIEPQFCLCK